MRCFSLCVKIVGLTNASDWAINIANEKRRTNTFRIKLKRIKKIHRGKEDEKKKTGLQHHKDNKGTFISCMGDWGKDKVGNAVRNQPRICEVNDIVDEAISTSRNEFDDKFTNFHLKYVTMIWPWPVFATYHMNCYGKTKKRVFGKGSSRWPV